MTFIQSFSEQIRMKDFELHRLKTTSALSEVEVHHLKTTSVLSGVEVHHCLIVGCQPED